MVHGVYKSAFNPPASINIYSKDISKADVQADPQPLKSENSALAIEDTESSTELFPAAYGPYRSNEANK